MDIATPAYAANPDSSDKHEHEHDHDDQLMTVECPIPNITANSILEGYDPFIVSQELSAFGIDDPTLSFLLHPFECGLYPHAGHAGHAPTLAGSLDVLPSLGQHGAAPPQQPQPPPPTPADPAIPVSAGAQPAALTAPAPHAGHSHHHTYHNPLPAAARSKRGASATGRAEPAPKRAKRQPKSGRRRNSGDDDDDDNNDDDGEDDEDGNEDGDEDDEDGEDGEDEDEDSEIGWEGTAKPQPCSCDDHASNASETTATSPQVPLFSGGADAEAARLMDTLFGPPRPDSEDHQLVPSNSALAAHSAPDSGTAQSSNMHMGAAFGMALAAAAAAATAAVQAMGQRPGPPRLAGVCPIHPKRQAKASTAPTSESCAPSHLLLPAGNESLLAEKSNYQAISEGRMGETGVAFNPEAVQSVVQRKQMAKTTEKRRRNDMQSGYAELKTLVPLSRASKERRSSKATLLVDTITFIKALQRERAQYKLQVDHLSEENQELRRALASMTGGIMKHVQNSSCGTSSAHAHHDHYHRQIQGQHQQHQQDERESARAE